MPDIRSPGPEDQTPLPPSTAKVLAQARALFSAGKVLWKYHPEQERMPERGFDVFDVEYVIMNGYVPEPRPRPGCMPNEWKIKVVDQLEGTSRKMGVVCVVANERLVIIVTTEWEDR